MTISLERLAEINDEEIGHTEEDVKYNVVMSLLENFGHDRFRFEHDFNDIFIPNENYNILVETKKLGKRLDQYTHQLNRYTCRREIHLAILTNGSEFLFFSAKWNKDSYMDKLVLYFKRNRLKDPGIISVLEGLISKESIEKGMAPLELKRREDRIDSILKSENDDQRKKTELSGLHAYYEFTDNLDPRRGKGRRTAITKKRNPGEYDRQYWIDKSSKESLSISDELLEMSKRIYPDIRINYTQPYISVNASGRQFLWLAPNKSNYCRFRVRDENQRLKDLDTHLSELGIKHDHQKPVIFYIYLTKEELDQHREMIQEVLESSIKYNH